MSTVVRSALKLALLGEPRVVYSMDGLRGTDGFDDDFLDWVYDHLPQKHKGASVFGGVIEDGDHYISRKAYELIKSQKDSLRRHFEASRR